MKPHTEKYKIRLGFFVLGGLLLFIIAIFYIGKQKNFFNQVFRITTTFKDVSGLRDGNTIRFSGVNVGTVDNIIITSDSTVKVDMLIKKEVQQYIKSDCKVEISSEGIIGDRIVIINQGSPEAGVVEDGQQLPSKEPFKPESIISSLQVTAGNVEIISEQLAEIMLKLNNNKGTLSKLIEDSTITKDFDQSMENLATFMSKLNNKKGTLNKLIEDTTITENVNQTMENLRNSSKALYDNLEAAKHSIFFKRYFNKKQKEAKKNKSKD